MIQFLFQGGRGSHGPRAQALVAVTPGSRCGDIAATRPAMKAGLDTLAFWGHGDSHHLCGKTARELHELIKEWKRYNPSLKTVEIITCNAGHSVSGDPFARQLKSGIGFRSSLRGLTIKALPTTVTGASNAWSVLLAETNYNSWVYITAPGATDSVLMEAKTLVEYETTAEGRSVSFKGDMAVKADKLVRSHPTRKWTMNYGYLKTLRAHLNIV